MDGQVPLFLLTSTVAERILERKGMMAQTTHRNQKMMRTPEDCTPCSRSYWTSRVASSCARRAGEAGLEHIHLDLPPFPPLPWSDVCGVTPSLFPLPRWPGPPQSPRFPYHNPMTHWRPALTQLPGSPTDHGDPHHQGGDKEDGGGGPAVDQAMEGVEEVSPGDTPQQDAHDLQRGHKLGGQSLLAPEATGPAWAWP